MKDRCGILVLGGGKIGYFLARHLIGKEYRVGVMDRDPARARFIADETGITAYAGDGTDIESLRAAGIANAAYVIAVMGDDAANLVACQVAKKDFGVGTTIALVSDPRNEALFERLGVDETLCTTGLAIRLVEDALPSKGMRLLSVIGRSAAAINEFTLDGDSPADGVAVAALRLPPECVLVAVLRGDEVTFPRGDTILRAGDRVFGLSRAEAAADVRAALLGA